MGTGGAKPRVALAWAEYRLVEALPSGNEEVRSKWVAFLENKLRPAVRDVESAGTVAAQWAAIERVHTSIDALAHSRSIHEWSKTRALQEALDDLYNSSNVEFSIDSTAVSSFLPPAGIVEPGPIWFRNQWSYVTPGRIQGIGFVPTPDGIHLAIHQSFTSVTPIRGFQEQMAQDPRGQRATKMYQFSATSRNDAVLTMTALFRLASGLYLAPSYQHGVSAAINSTPVEGQGFGRLMASLMGFGQRRITNEVYNGAIGRMRDEVVDGSRELSSIRTTASAARLNEQIRPYVLDEHSVGVDRWKLTSMKLETFETHAVARGIVAVGSAASRGASAAQPRPLLSPTQGITTDVHLPSALTNLVAGVYDSDTVKDVETLMIEPAAPDASAPRITTNADFAAYSKALQDARDAGRPAQVVRFRKPPRAPLFSVNPSGNLVVLVSDLMLDVPAPSQAAGGGLAGPPARIYRIQSPQAELNLEIAFEPAAQGKPASLTARIVGFDPGGQMQVLAIVDDEEKGTKLNVVQARVITTALAARLAGQSIPLPLDSVPAGSLKLQSVSKLDPTGWLRLVIMPVDSK